MQIPPVIVHIVTDLEQAVETKVKAATTASAITGFIVTEIGSLTVFHAQPVPAVITSAVGALVTGGLTFVAGWLAKHTPRASDVKSTVIAAEPPA